MKTRYSFGGDEHIFVECDEEMSLEAFFKGMSITTALREAQIKGLSSWARVKDYRLFQLQRMANVSLYAGSAMTAQMIADFGADHVLLATGATWRGDGAGRTRLSGVPGMAGQALTPDDLMQGTALEGPVVIYDDDHHYMANALAAAHAHRLQPELLVVHLQ